MVLRTSGALSGWLKIHSLVDWYVAITQCRKATRQTSQRSMIMANISDASILFYKLTEDAFTGVGPLNVSKRSSRTRRGNARLVI
jgi:hypothetical protein